MSEKQPQPLGLSLYVEEINFILGALSKLPYDQVHLLMLKIQHQATEQLKAQQTPTDQAPPIDMH